MYRGTVVLDIFVRPDTMSMISAIDRADPD
jgi:hypothetical protein